MQKQGLSLVTKSSNEKLNSIIESTFPNLHSLFITDKTGELLSYFVSDECCQICDLTKLKEVAKLVSIRFNIGNFQNLAGGHLEVTINVFEEHIMLVRSFGEDKILAIMVPKKIGNLEYILNAVRSFEDSKLKKYRNLNKSDVQHKSEKLKKIPSYPTEFQKMQSKKLQPKEYVLVGEPYLDLPTDEK